MHVPDGLRLIVALCMDADGGNEPAQGLAYFDNLQSERNEQN